MLSWLTPNRRQHLTHISVNIYDGPGSGRSVTPLGKALLLLVDIKHLSELYFKFNERHWLEEFGRQERTLSTLKSFPGIHYLPLITGLKRVGSKACPMLTQAYLKQMVRRRRDTPARREALGWAAIKAQREFKRWSDSAEQADGTVTDGCGDGALEYVRVLMELGSAGVKGCSTS